MPHVRDFTRIDVYGVRVVTDHGHQTAAGDFYVAGAAGGYPN
jgi:hypothetical protein